MISHFSAGFHPVLSNRNSKTALQNKRTTRLGGRDRSTDRLDSNSGSQSRNVPNLARIQVGRHWHREVGARGRVRVFVDVEHAEGYRVGDDRPWNPRRDACQCQWARQSQNGGELAQISS
eukprot:1753033-Rhodomonas_salina.1